MRTEGDPIHGGRAPVLAADVGVLPSVVTHGETGLIYKDSYEFVAFARKLATDAELRKQIGIAGRQRVAKLYSIHHWMATGRFA
jgi:glycosyltransferase involved in cell wall biosynthesis